VAIEQHGGKEELGVEPFPDGEDDSVKKSSTKTAVPLPAAAPTITEPTGPKPSVEPSITSGPLTIQPGRLKFPASGGKQDLQITNKGSWAQAIQIEPSDPAKVRIRPEAIILDVGDTTTISVMHGEGGSMAGNLSIRYKNTSLDIEDARDAFKPVPAEEKIDSDRGEVPIMMQMQ